MPASIKSWFQRPGRENERTLDQQLTGLEWLLCNCAGRTVLDIGCAEGLISIELLKRGALAAHGVEFVRDRVEAARGFAGALPATFEQGDANNWQPQRRYGIVLLLAILHKLSQPAERARVYARACSSVIALRTPPAGAPAIVDRRSQFVRQDIAQVFHEEGFYQLLGGPYGPLGEWIGIYRRREWRMT